MTPTPPTSDPCLDVIVEIELAIDGRNSADRAAFIHDAIARHPQCAEAIRSHFLMAALNRHPSPPPTDPHRFRKGDEVGGRYHIERFIARGGMGEVYEATDLLLERTVAFKVIRPLTDLATTRDRFHREGVVLADVHHTNVVPIHDTGEVGGVRFHALQFVRGITLHRALDAIRQDVLGPHSSASLRRLVEPLLESATRDRPSTTAHPPSSLPPTAPPQADTPPARRPFGPDHFTSVAEVLAQAADGLHHAHEKGYCHRDVKPSNVMLDTDGVCRLIDFGLAGFTETGQVVGEGTAEPGVTHGPLGTWPYMAPEQFDARADARSDVWGLGVTLYEFLTLGRPFPGTTFAELKQQTQNDTPVHPRKVVPEVPADLEGICLKALAKNPADRYQTTQAMADDLRRWLSWRPTTVLPRWYILRPLGLWAWRHQGLSLALVLLLTLVGLVCGWGYQRSEQQLADASAKAERDRQEATAKSDRQRKELAFLKVEDEVTTFRRRGYGHVGWPTKLHEYLDRMHDLRPEVSQRDLRATALIGLDCRLMNTYSVPQTEGQHRGMAGVAFSPSGKRVAAGGMRLSHLPTPDHTPAMTWGEELRGEPIRSTEVGSGPVTFLDEQIPLQLIEPTLDRPTVLLWNLATNRKLAEVPVAGEVDALALAPGGRRFAVSGTGGTPSGTTVWAYSPGEPTPVTEIARWDGTASALAFSADGRYLAVGTTTGQVTVHSLTGDRASVALPDIHLVVNSLAFGRGFRRAGGVKSRLVPGGIPELQLAVGTASGKLVVYDLEILTATTTVHDFSHFIRGLAFSPDGATVAVAGHSKPALVDLATERVRFEFSGMTDDAGRRHAYTGVAFSPDGARIAFTGFNEYGNGSGGVDLFALDQDRGVRTYHGLSGWIQKAHLSETTECLAALSHQWQVAVWERETGRLRFVWQVPAGAWADNACLAFDHDERSVIVAGGTHISRYCLTTGKRLGGWRVDDGWNDTIILRPGGQVWSLRREYRQPVVPWPIEFHQSPTACAATAIGSIQWPKPTEVVLRNLSPDGTTEVIYRRPRPRPGTALHLIRPSADGREVDFELTAGGKTLFVRWDVATGEERPVVPTSLPHGAGVVTSEGEGVGLKLIEADRTEPSMVFDLGNQITFPSTRIPVRRLAQWGRRDGTVLVADIDRCLKALEKYPR